MKKKIIQVFFALFSIFSGMNNAYTQSVNSITNPVYLKNEAEDRFIARLLNSLLIRESVIPRAERNFSKAYKNVTNVKWDAIKNGFAAKFILNEIKTIIYYDKKGRWIGSLKNYKEEKMSTRIRGIIKAVYYNYNILYIQEIELNKSENTPTYVIGIEDSTSIKILRIYEDHMEVWKEYRKSS